MPARSAGSDVSSSAALTNPFSRGSVTIASTSDQRLLSRPYMPIALYIGMARNAAGMK